MAVPHVILTVRRFLINVSYQPFLAREELLPPCPEMTVRITLCMDSSSTALISILFARRPFCISIVGFTAGMRCDFWQNLDHLESGSTPNSGLTLMLKFRFEDPQP